MSKIKIITDSASDIPKEYSAKHNIRVLGFPITVGDRSFRDGDIPAQEYYDLIDGCGSLPVHSQLTVFEFEELFEEYEKQGYTDIFFISINSFGSATYQNACLAKKNFAGDANIRVLDSGTYSGTYGYPVIQAAAMAEEGKSADEIESYLTGWFDCCEVYLAAYTLRYVKKSGRISAAAAFAGELLGLKPIILLSRDVTKVVSKPRGDQNVVSKLADVVCSRIEKGSPYIVISGRDKSRAEDLRKLLEQRLGYPAADVPFEVGGAVAANSGPDIVAAAFRAASADGD
ncbi:MAG: DegV family protein [Ruminococcus sp.]|nr:DegV family protein [Ruminococcus sp.]